MYNKVIKRDEKKFQLPLVLAEPWRGLDAETPQPGLISWCKAQEINSEKK
jgi:hypothetical protein